MLKHWTVYLGRSAHPLRVSCVGKQRKDYNTQNRTMASVPALQLRNANHANQT